MASVFKRGGKRNRIGRYYISRYDHTGTDDATAEVAQRQAQQSGRESVRSDSDPGDERTQPSGEKKRPSHYELRT